MEFSVWAPQRQRVDVRTGRTDHPMERGEHGWWRRELPGAGPGTEYAFRLDGARRLLPDPRSLRQPGGVHAPSQVYDHDAFEWTDHGWTGRILPGCVVYELHVGTFTPAGTFDAAAGRLDHLVELGVDAISLLPVNSFDGTHGWGYDGVLWYAVHEPYGGPDGLKRLVDACHRRGLAVLLDVVYNHLGPGALLDRFGPYFAGDGAWGPSLNLDGPGSDEVRRYVLDNALSWLRDFHLDGLRLDAVHALADTRAIHLLEQLAVEVDALATHVRRPLSLVAESDLNDARLVTAREAGGYGLHAQWNDDLHHSLHAALTGERRGYYVDFGPLTTLAATFQRVFRHDGSWSEFRRRSHGRPVDLNRTPAHRFLAYLQNHDQVGNRAAGDRLGASLSPGLLACGAALVLCSPYTPMVFMGEEWGARTPWQFFASFPDGRLADKVRAGRREEFAAHGWTGDVPDPLDPATYERSKLDWAEPGGQPHDWVMEVYRRLIGLRRSHPELSDPGLAGLRIDVDEDGRTIVMHRGRLRVVCNLGGAEAVVDPAGRVADLLYGSPDVVLTGGNVRLPAEAFAVVAVSPPGPASPASPAPAA